MKTTHAEECSTQKRNERPLGDDLTLSVASLIFSPHVSSKINHVKFEGEDPTSCDNSVWNTWLSLSNVSLLRLPAPQSFQNTSLASKDGLGRHVYHKYTTLACCPKCTTRQRCKDLSR
eukprot:482889-Amphidinium_carterae.1